MKKGWIITIVIIIMATLAFALYFWFFKDTEPNSNQQPQSNSQYNATRTTGEIENETNSKAKVVPAETELYSFSTPIKSDDKNRLTNIKITCSRINETVVKAGKEFSFCKVVGQPSSDDGYKPADAFGKDNKIIQAIGGGNCQVSTTVYNAALGVKGLKITERHEHDRDVAYIQDGKDATVAYDYLDLKFKNTNQFDIKLYAFVSDGKVFVKVFRVS